MGNILEVKNLSVEFKKDKKPFFAVSDVSFDVKEGEILGLAGESGCGKSSLSRAILGIQKKGVTGSVKHFAKRPQMVFQDPAGSLNPSEKIEFILEEPIKVKGHFDKEERKRRVRDMLKKVDLDEEILDRYPHELSGGMARRVLLCCALMDSPRLIIADEPTPGLDLDLAVRALADFREFANAGGGVMLITHDIELALQVADRVAVFKDGTIIEETGVESFRSPDTLQHPFTKALWHALPEHGFCAEFTGSDCAC